MSNSTTPHGFTQCRILFISGCLEGITIDKPVVDELCQVDREVEGFGSGYRVLEVGVTPSPR